MSRFAISTIKDDAATSIGHVLSECENRGWTLISCSTGPTIISTMDLRSVGGDGPKELARVYGFEEPILFDRIKWAMEKARAADASEQARRARTAAKVGTNQGEVAVERA